MTVANGNGDVGSYAREYRAAGLQIVPIKIDGSKMPLGKWKHLQDPKSHCELSRFAGQGIGLICGLASDGLEVVDFDDPSLYSDWCELVEQRLPGLIQRLTIIQTPRMNDAGHRGRHVAYRCPEPSGNTVLAHREQIDPDNDPGAAIETRGEGGLVVTVGSPGKCHESGRCYELLAGDLCDLPTITMAERNTLFDCARALTRWVKAADHGEDDVPEQTQPCDDEGDTPGNQFAAATSWGDILTPHGWVLDHKDHWRRPGKKLGTSATTTCTSKAGNELLYVFSTSASPFSAGESYSKFAVFTLLNHGGDYAAAAKALASEGYGGTGRDRGYSWNDSIGGSGRDEQALGDGQAPTDHEKSQYDAPPRHTLDALVAANPTLRPPIIHGLLRRGETMNLVAAPKQGKSWLVNGLALCMADGREWLDTYPCEPGRVLLIDGELHPETIAHRLPMVARALEIGTECFKRITIWPLRGRGLNMRSLGLILKDISPDEYDLIVLDAWYRFLPEGVSENDNASVMSLYNLIDLYTSRLNAGWINIHHTSKGDQSQKGTTDVGSGAGSQSRAADSHLIIRPHEEEGVAVLDAVVRSWPPVEPLSIRWDFPVWRLADSDPGKLRRPVSPAVQRREADDADAIKKIIAKLAGSEQGTAREIRGWTGISRDRLGRLLDRLQSEGRVIRTEESKRGKLCDVYTLAPAGELAGDDFLPIARELSPASLGVVGGSTT